MNSEQQYYYMDQPVMYNSAYYMPPTSSAAQHATGAPTTSAVSTTVPVPVTAATAATIEPPMLVASSSSSTTSSSSTSNTYQQTLARASSLPDSFYPEFLQYSKENFEPQSKKQRKEDDEVDEDNMQMSTAEMRRQIHIQSEQKRRAQIKDGFEDLRNELPACLNKKMSKVALLHRTVQHIQHLKSTQMTILSELERLVHENEQLRKFQQNVLQKQALENMYTMGNL
ncbi:hypothetical protein BCR43DRAFT_482989 [Syncephalastrum racemosum]|uniref:BHLH domain-containing protein n=1 Tax=Syncephalastrum racemosum TaxID=13706 RepID=A0A1X2HUJ8_SYNRA|nr:hypothetical protein BCR43DRAFT_482989 [Syncephalastrum racemosum]